MRASFQAHGAQMGGIVDGKNDDSHLRRLHPRVTNHRQAVYPRHLEFQQGQVRVQLQNPAQRLRAALGDAHHVQFHEGIQVQVDNLEEDCGTIRQDDPDAPIACCWARKHATAA